MPEWKPSLPQRMDSKCTSQSGPCSLLPGWWDVLWVKDTEPELPRSRNLCLSPPQGPPISPRLILNPSSNGSFLARLPQRPPKIESSQHKVSCLRKQTGVSTGDLSLIPSSDPGFQLSLGYRLFSSASHLLGSRGYNTGPILSWAIIP